MGLMLEQVEGRTEDVPRAEVVVVPYKHGKPFITYEEEINPGMQMYNLHIWYMQMSRKEMNMFGVKYRDQNFFRGRMSSGCTSNFYITYTIDKPWTFLSSPFLFCKYHLSLD